MDKDRATSKNKTIWKKIILLIIILLAIIGITGTIFFYNKYQQFKNDSTTVAQQETKMLVQDIGKITILPNGEDPTVATVTDSTKLTDQIFFKDTQNGDKILVYTVAKKAILYRPSANKIINIAPFDINSGSDADNSVSK